MSDNTAGILKKLTSLLRPNTDPASIHSDSHGWAQAIYTSDAPTEGNGCDMVEEYRSAAKQRCEQAAEHGDPDAASRLGTQFGGGTVGGKMWSKRRCIYEAMRGDAEMWTEAWDQMDADEMKGCLEDILKDDSQNVDALRRLGMECDGCTVGSEELSKVDCLVRALSISPTESHEAWRQAPWSGRGPQQR